LAVGRSPSAVAQTFEQRLLAFPTPPAFARCRAISPLFRTCGHAGTGRDADYVLDRMKSWGSTPEQRVHHLSAAAGYGSRWIITGRRATPSPGRAGKVASAAFNGYTDGDATADVIYVNYG